MVAHLNLIHSRTREPRNLFKTGKFSHRHPGFISLPSLLDMLM